MRELERQVGALVFQRLAMNRDQEQVRTLARDGQHVAVPSDVLKDPFVLEFLDVKEPPSARERGLEQAIIDRLEGFLLEMGKGFCFVARQKRLTLDGDKNDAMVKITLPKHNEQILAARYQMYLPTEEELRAELARGREEVERALRLQS